MSESDAGHVTTVTRAARVMLTSLEKNKEKQRESDKYLIVVVVGKKSKVNIQYIIRRTRRHETVKATDAAISRT